MNFVIDFVLLAAYRQYIVQYSGADSAAFEA